MITVGQAKYLVAVLLERCGVTRDHAEVTARAIVLAECWGIPSHGLLRVPYYLSRLGAGGYPPGAALRTVRDSGPLVVLDGGGGLGHWQLWEAARIASKRCAEYGVAAVAVGNSGHCGALGVYTLPGLDRGAVSLIFSNGPAVMPAWGGSNAVLSTSPFAVGIPCRPRPAIVDMATSAVARGKIAECASRGESIPDGWAYDACGRPTNNADVALSGMLSPFGGAKGFALAFAVEALSAGLVGPTLSTGVADMFEAEHAARSQRIAHLIIALDPATLDVVDAGSADDDSADRLDRLAAQIEASGARVPGSGRLHPDEIDDAQELFVDAGLVETLVRRAERLDVVVPGLIPGAFI